MKTIENVRKKNNLLEQFATLLLFLLGIGVCCLFVLENHGSEMNSVLDYSAHYGGRLGMIVFSMLAWFKTQTMLEERKNKRDEITDILHQVSDPVNRYF